MTNSQLHLNNFRRALQLLKPIADDAKTIISDTEPGIASIFSQQAEELELHFLSIMDAVKVKSPLSAEKSLPQAKIITSAAPAAASASSLPFPPVHDSGSRAKMAGM